jgi:hypothetical protein
MFRENDQHRQQSFLTGAYALSSTLQDRLRNSWAETFYHEVFCRIDETLFAGLYSDAVSRPNVAVNVLVAFEILKSGLGLSDEALYNRVCFDLLVRHALGLGDLAKDVFALRTVYNFRTRVREHAAETGENLMQTVFEQVTDEQLAALHLRTGLQRMDSTQVLSNLAQWSRLELLVGVVQSVYRGLPEALRNSWAEPLAVYLDGRPHQVCYRIQAGEERQHLETLGEQLYALSQDLAAVDPEHAKLALLKRVLEEQYVVSPEGAVSLRAGQEISAQSLQSPHDPEATYRKKGGKEYRGGYVANVSETADPENEVQLITDVQVESNHTDDTQLMDQALTGQQARGIEVTSVVTDGGYSGALGDAVCANHEVELRPTRLRGGVSRGEQWGWDAYTWEVDAERTPLRVTCPGGETVELEPSSRSPDRSLARFPRQSCDACPFYGKQCRVEERQNTGPTFSVTHRSVSVARMRQRLCPEDARLRAPVEGTMWQLKHPFGSNQLPVRGLIRVRMVLYGSALMVNLRRIHRHIVAKQAARSMKTADVQSQTPFWATFSPLERLRAWLGRLRRLSAPVGLLPGYASLGAH